MTSGLDSQEPHKRKRDSDDRGVQLNHVDRIPQPPPPIQSGHSTVINYLPKPSAGRLDLIQGDSDTFADVLGLLNSYEGVLSRQESLAATLGAKLTGPRLLRAMESAFEGPIIISSSFPSPSSHYVQETVSWLDIVTFAKQNPDQFHLTTGPQGERSCQFFLKNLQVQILEDDWRLIVSGALDRFSVVSTAPLDEDDATELATLDIVEEKLLVLIKKADEVAKRARQLNYQLSGRKAAIRSRHAGNDSLPGFQTLNSPHRSGPLNNLGYDLHNDLLQQFHASSSQSRPYRSHSGSHLDTLITGQHYQGPTERRLTPHSAHHNRSPPLSSSGLPHRESFDPSAAHRAVITARIEKLGKGDTIWPPCDRCRRLKTPCIKHLTACQGCTKKHAKCGWKSITDEEMARLDREGSHVGENDGAANGPGPGYASSQAYESAQDDHRHSADESVGSRGETSRPASRGDHRAGQPVSPGDVGITLPQRQGAALVDGKADAMRTLPRPWETASHHRGDYFGPRKDHTLSIGHSLSSSIASPGERRESQDHHVSTHSG